MASTTKISKGDDEVYESVDANLATGVLVIPSTTATSTGKQGIKVATDGAKNVLGVNASSTITAANGAAIEQSTGADGYGVTYADYPDRLTTVYSHGIFPLTYTAAAVNFGDKIAAAASGQVRKWVTGDGADAIIGYCAEPGGVTSSGGVKRARLNI